MFRRLVFLDRLPRPVAQEEGHPSCNRYDQRDGLVGIDASDLS